MAVRFVASPTRTTTALGRRRTRGLLLCRRHAAPLLTMAVMILNDIDAASEIVATTIAAACRPVGNPQRSTRRTRIELARSVYWRCIGRLATIERFGPAPIGPAPRTYTAASETGDRAISGLMALPTGHRAIVALTLFGAHDLHHASRTLQMPTADVVRHLRETISIGGGRGPVRPA